MCVFMCARSTEEGQEVGEGGEPNRTDRVASSN